MKWCHHCTEYWQFLGMCTTALKFIPGYCLHQQNRGQKIHTVSAGAWVCMVHVMYRGEQMWVIEEGRCGASKGFRW
jgi:hypothetical protein